MASTTRALFTVEIANLGRIGRQAALLALMVVAFVMGGMPQIIAVVCATLVTSLSLASINAELTNGISLLYASWPVTRHDVVASHFRFAGALTLLAFVLTAGLTAITGLVHPAQGSIASVVGLGCLIMAGVSIVTPITMPVRMKFGVQAGNVIVIVIVAAAVMLGGFLGGWMAPNRTGLSEVWLIIIGLVVLNAISWTASYLAAQRTYSTLDL